MKARAAGLLLALSGIPLAHAVDDSALARCRSIVDPAARLRCYDGLPLGSAPVAPAAPQPVPAAPSRAPAPPAASAPATQAAPAPVPPPAAQPGDFGMEQRKATELPTTMQSQINGRFEGWGPRSRITLANGQVWQIVDDSQAVVSLDNPKVVVRRGMMGGFFLEVEGFNRSPRVRRVQ